MDADAQRIVRIRDGDERALRELYDALGGNVFALALRMTGSREDAEEVLQDTFVNVHAAAARFDAARGSARAWVYTIARNVARMKLRARSARPAAGADESALPPRRSARPGPDAEATDRIALERAFSVLDPQEVQLLRDAFFAGFSHAELAERDGVPLGTVKSRLRRAMLKARGALGEASS